MKDLAAIAGVFVMLCALPAFAGDPTLAPTPPMGWNSWDSYGRTITEAQLLANARWMAEHLKPSGWQYVVMDEGWYVLNPESDPKDYKFQLSADGRFLPAPSRFPSAANDAGLKPIADQIHALGLNFGLHIIRGIPREAAAKNLPIAGASYRAAEAADTSDRCPWNAYNYGVKNNAAGQAYYDSIFELYARWGVDFVKADCIADHPYKPDEIRMIHLAIQRAGRPMVLSLSPGPTAIEHVDEVAKYSEMWRICDDFWDHWGPWEKHEWSQSLYAQFATTAKWAAHVKPGNWPDADMLPLGRLGPSPGAGDVRNTRFTRDEQRTMMSLWAIFRSPLIMGGDLLSMDPWTTSLLTNAEVLAVNQLSRENHPVLTSDRAALWLARPEDGDGYYLAVFNIGDSEQTLHYPWKDLGIAEGSYRVRDLWEAKDLAAASDLRATLKPHASALYRLTAAH
jgi:hypothetical protein